MIKYFLEIKNRVTLIAITLLFSLFVSYSYKEILIFLFIKPNKTVNMDFDLPVFYFIFTDLTEVFSIYLKIISFINIQVTILYIIYHCFIFFSPALFKKEYYFYRKLIITCFLSWFMSLLLSRFLLIPLSWQFFFSFQSFISNKFISLYFEPKVSEYLNFCLFIYQNCILYCQFFVFIFFIINHFIYSINIIKKYRKFYYFSFVIFSTVISPPDVLSQFVISITLIVIYELSIIKLILKKFLIR